MNNLTITGIVVPVRRFYCRYNYGQIKALQRTDILRGTCPMIVSSPCICLITTTKRIMRIAYFALAAQPFWSWILPYGFVPTNCRRYLKTKHCCVFLRVSCVCFLMCFMHMITHAFQFSVPLGFYLLYEALLNPSIS